MLPKSIRYLIGALALLVSLYGAISSAAAEWGPGVDYSADAALITGVVIGGPAWRDGIRPGDAVAELHTSADPGGWLLMVTDSSGWLGTSVAGETVRLRATLPFATAGLVLVAVALLLLAGGSLPGLALLPIGAGLATMSLVMSNRLGEALLGGPGTFLIGGAAVALVSRGRTRLVALALGTALAVLSTAALTRVPGLFDGMDAARLPSAVAFSAWCGWIAVDRRRLAARLLAPGGPSLFDLVYIPGALAILVAAVVLFDAPVVVAVGVGAVVLLAYPFSRRAMASTFERLVVGTMRRDAEIRAIEDERGRLARDIHDEPLQGLAAVIRRLDAVPAAAGETSALREIASQLRDVATALRPPVLEDLGLAAALQDLAETLAAAHPDWSIVAEVDDLTRSGERPGADVEVAAYRVAQEAAANALRHSRGRRLSITASVGTDSIDLSVSDDGTGIDRHSAAAARRQGHFGLDAMRERAEAAGASLSMESGVTGVRVRLEWERPA